MEWLAYIAFLAVGFGFGYAIKSMTANTTDSGDVHVEIAKLTAEAQAAGQQNQDIKNERDIAQEEARTLLEQLARANEKVAAFNEAQETARNQFKNLATELLQETSANFKEQSKESLENLLTPLDKQLNEFKTEITGFKAINEKMTSETESLTKALTTNVKAQGNWGEFILERILEESGLQKGREYVLQGEGMNLKSAEGGRQMPDVVINLPEGRHIVVDSKVSLNSFRDYQNSETEEDKQKAAKAFIASTESHINDLSGKNYQGAYGLQTLDFVMMFMPVEPAYFLLMSEREEILQKAWDKGISIVSPSNLFPNLRTIGYLWRLQRQNENADEIARLGGTIYDKVNGFLGDMQEVGKALDKAGEKHEEAVKKLSSGKGNVLSQAEKLKQMGAKTTKSLPDMAKP